MTHLYIELNTSGIEEVNASIISKLYELAISGNLDNTSDLKGRLHSSAVKDIHINYLNNHYQDLYISADKIYITFVDPKVEQIILNQGWGDGVGVTLQDLGLITTFSGSVFGGSNITSFNEYKYFANATTQSGAFSGCSNLTSIEYPPSSTSVGEEAHLNNTSLTHVKIDNTLITSISDKMFFGCSSLQSITLPATCTSIGRYSFQNCTALSTIDLSNITKLSTQSFRDSGLTSVNLSNVTNLESNVFNGCTSLEIVTGLNNAIEIPPSIFYNCRSLSDIDIDWSKILHISQSAFLGCTNLPIKDFSAPNLSSLDAGAFRSCTSLTSISNLGNITSIGAGARRGYGEGTFTNCTSLTSVTIPSTVSVIGNSAFSACPISNINVVWENIITLGEGAFSGRTDWNIIVNLANLINISENFLGKLRGTSYIRLLYIPKIESGDSNGSSEPIYYKGYFTGISTGILYLKNIKYFYPGDFYYTSCVNLVINNTTPPEWRNHLNKTDEETTDVNHSRTRVFANSTINNIYVPDSAVSAYLNDSNWSTVSDKIKPLSQLAKVATEADLQDGLIALIEAYMDTASNSQTQEP